jgi:hypothetical protein
LITTTKPVEISSSIAKVISYLLSPQPSHGRKALFTVLLVMESPRLLGNFDGIFCMSAATAPVEMSSWIAQ